MFFFLIVQLTGLVTERAMPSRACHSRPACYNGFLPELFPLCPREGNGVLLSCLSLAQQLSASELCSRQNEQDVFSAFHKEQVQGRMGHCSVLHLCVVVIIQYI